MQQIKELLALDNSSRKAGSSTDLWTLDHISVNKRWDYSLPTLVPISYEDQKRITVDRDGFRERLYKAIPFLPNVNLTNTCIAGGFASTILLDNHTSRDQDIDIFIYGLTEEEANKRVRNLVQDLIDCFETYLDTKEGQYISKTIEAVRNNYTLTLTLGNWKFQIIFRLYNFISEILHGFDLGSSAIGWADDQLYFTSLSKFCYEHRVNILDNTRRSATYEARLVKYMVRGFALVLPNLNTSILPRRHLKFNKAEIAELPFLVFSYTRVDGNRIYVKDFLTVGPNQADPDAREHDYGDDRNGFTSFHSNLYNLLHGRDNLYYYANGDYVPKIFDNPLNITRAQIEDFYSKIPNRLYSDGRFSVRDLERYLPEYDLATAFRDLVINKNSTVLEEMVVHHKNRLFTALDAQHKVGIKWITDEPGSQICGAFHPIKTTDVEWYGGYYQQ